MYLGRIINAKIVTSVINDICIIRRIIVRDGRYTLIVYNTASVGSLGPGGPPIARHNRGSQWVGGWVGGGHLPLGFPIVVRAAHTGRAHGVTVLGHAICLRPGAPRDGPVYHIKYLLPQS